MPPNLAVQPATSLCQFLALQPACFLLWTLSLHTPFPIFCWLGGSASEKNVEVLAASCLCLCLWFSCNSLLQVECASSTKQQKGEWMSRFIVVFCASPYQQWREVCVSMPIHIPTAVWPSGRRRLRENASFLFLTPLLLSYLYSFSSWSHWPCNIVQIRKLLTCEREEGKERGRVCARIQTMMFHSCAIPIADYI